MRFTVDNIFAAKAKADAPNFMPRLHKYRLGRDTEKRCAFKQSSTVPQGAVLLIPETT